MTEDRALREASARVGGPPTRASVEGEILRDAIRGFERAGLGFCVLNSYTDYPERIGSDVDAVAEFPARVPRLLSENPNTVLVQAARTRAAAATSYVLCRWHEGRPRFLTLHVGADCRRHGRVFLRAEEFFKDSRPFEFFRVPSPAPEFAAYLVKKVHQGSLEESRARRLGELYREDPAGCGRYLRRLLPPEEAGMVARAAEGGDWNPVRARMAQLRKAMARRVDRERPLEVLLNRLGDHRQRLQNAVGPPGLMVAVLGVDGAGKSTVMAALERDLGPAFWSTKQYHGRALESPLRWTKRVREQRRRRDAEIEAEAEKSRKKPRDPHAKSLRGLGLSLVKLGVWWADFTFLGYVMDVHPRLRRSGLVLFDRYYQDLLVDPRRHRYGGPLWLARLAGRFFPKPDLVVLLDAAPEVLYARKREVSLDETTRQREAYLDLVKEIPNGRVVDASRSPREVAAGVEKIILDYMSERTARRLGLGRTRL